MYYKSTPYKNLWFTAQFFLCTCIEGFLHKLCKVNKKRAKYNALNDFFSYFHGAQQSNAIEAKVSLLCEISKEKPIHNLPFGTILMLWEIIYTSDCTCTDSVNIVYVLLHASVQILTLFIQMSWHSLFVRHFHCNKKKEN